MQTLAAYFIFLLVVVAVGLATILGAIVTLAAYEGIAWMKSRPGFHRWKGVVLQALVLARARIGSGLHVVGQEIHVQLVHANQWIKQPL